MRVLLVEDDYKVGRFIEKGLAEQGYACSWGRSLAEGRDLFYEGGHDAAILDLGLPDGDGLNLLREWRKEASSFPVIILSARDAVEDRVHGLNYGADDYLIKPFSFEELLARLRSVLRRQDTPTGMRREYQGIAVDLLSRKVFLNGFQVETTNREFALFELFVSNPRRVLTRTQIAEKIWDVHFEMETNLINVYVRRLRKKLEAHGLDHLLQTVRGVGYQLE